MKVSVLYYEPEAWYESAVLIWFFILWPWLAWLLVAAVLIREQIVLPEMILKTPPFPVLPFLLLLNLGVYLWAIVDAYNRPV